MSESEEGFSEHATVLESATAYQADPLGLNFQLESAQLTGKLAGVWRVSINLQRGSQAIELIEVLNFELVIVPPCRLSVNLFEFTPAPANSS